MITIGTKVKVISNNWNLPDGGIGVIVEQDTRTGYKVRLSSTGMHVWRERGEIEIVRPFKSGDEVIVTKDDSSNKGLTGTVAPLSKTSKVEVRIQGSSYFYREDEIKLVKEGETQVQNNNRVFKQIKDGITTAKGALWHEEHDKFSIKDEDEAEFNKDSNTAPVIRNKELITESKDFVEVFKVSPEYMTAEELEQFEAFKKSLKKPVTKKKKTAKKSK